MFRTEELVDDMLLDVAEKAVTQLTDGLCGVIVIGVALEVDSVI
jgi:hypothetical protein